MLMPSGPRHPAQGPVCVCSLSTSTAAAVSRICDDSVRFAGLLEDVADDADPRIEATRVQLALETLEAPNVTTWLRSPPAADQRLARRARQALRRLQRSALKFLHRTINAAVAAHVARRGGRHRAEEWGVLYGVAADAAYRAAFTDCHEFPWDDEYGRSHRAWAARASRFALGKAARRPTARPVGVIPVARSSGTWLVRTRLGRDPESGELRRETCNDGQPCWLVDGRWMRRDKTGALEAVPIPKVLTAAEPFAEVAHDEKSELPKKLDFVDLQWVIEDAADEMHEHGEAEWHASILRPHKAAEFADLRAALARLPSKERAVLRELDRLDAFGDGAYGATSAAADALGISRETVNERKKDALARLRRLLE